MILNIGKPGKALFISEWRFDGKSVFFEGWYHEKRGSDPPSNDKNTIFK